MSQDQLRDAFRLMKEGEKRQAGMIVKGVLRNDSQNADAWWLMANILDDEDKIVKALERVLTIKPEHNGARKKLASLRPEYSNLTDNNIFTATDKKGIPQKPINGRSNKMLVMAVAGIAVLLFGLVGALLFMFDDNESSIRGDVIYSETVQVGNNETREIEIIETGIVTITAEGIGDFDPVLLVYANGDVYNPIADNDDHDNIAGLDTFDSAVEYVRIGSGVTVALEEFFGDSGQATVTVTRLNDNTIQQGIITIGGSRSGTIEVGGAIEFVVDSNGRVTITAEGDSSVDPVLLIFDERGHLIGYNDDNFIMSNLGALDSGIEDIQLSGLTYIYVRDYWNNSSGQVTVSIE